MPFVVRFMQDTIVAAGNSPYLMHWGLSGKLKYKVRCRSVFISSVFYSRESEPVHWSSWSMVIIINCSNSLLLIYSEVKKSKRTWLCLEKLFYEICHRNYLYGNLACTPDLGQVVLTVPSPLKREDSFLLGVGGRSTLGTAGSWSRHSQPHCSGSTVSGCSSSCRMFFLHLLAGMLVCRLGTPSLYI